ncbi:hypothetical protein [Winkia neuii]|uniref:hypothetical protein n=1 Tax=Winkia neuii TaxID=33007 RepID=UPI00046262EB|nr:hypothetical protein [Winkia neuii]MDK8100587.1 hypothetical protein [Winkia neuii]
MASSIEGFRPYRGEGSYEPHRVRVKENKSGHSADDLSGGVDSATGHAGTIAQHLLKRMSDYPDQPRKYSHKKLAIPMMIPASLVWVIEMVDAIVNYNPSDTEYDISAFLVKSGFTVVICVIAYYGLFFRIGVDEEKVWCRFWPFYYKEVRFDEVTRFETPDQRYKLFAGKKKIRLNYVRFDFTLVLIRLLVELDKRRFTLRKVGVDDPDFENEARIFRKIWANWVREDHWNYYVRFPDEMERIRVLAHLPAEWTEPIDADRRRRTEQAGHRSC